MDKKKCSKCCKIKGFDCFCKNKLKKDGIDIYCKKCCKEYYKKNKEKAKEYYQNNKEKIKEYSKNNKEKITEQKKEYRKNNKERRNEYLTNKRNIDPLYNFKSILRGRTYKAFKSKSWNKNSATEGMLKCDYITAYKHIENQFTEGMSWDNHGEWHIDHIIPLAIANNTSELEILCHYTNLQPLWAGDNLKKGAKYYN